PSRAARAPPGGAIAARFLSAARRPLLDAGGLGVDRRLARRPVAEPLFRRAGIGAPHPQIRSRGSLRAARAAPGAQRLPAGDRAARYPTRPGSMGRPIPGHRVAVVSAAGEPMPSGETGIIAAKRPDPVMFLGYWNSPAATAAKFAGDYLLTGDVALQDDDG